MEINENMQIGKYNKLYASNSHCIIGLERIHSFVAGQNNHPKRHCPCPQPEIVRSAPSAAVAFTLRRVYFRCLLNFNHIMKRNMPTYFGPKYHSWKDAGIIFDWFFEYFDRFPRMHIQQSYVNQIITQPPLYPHAVLWRFK